MNLLKDCFVGLRPPRNDTNSTTSKEAQLKPFDTNTLKFLFLFAFLNFGLCHADTVSPQVCHQDNCVNVEVVSKEDDMARGLMYRKSLGRDKGMLFVFSFDDQHQFWMKNMNFNLDMLWIARDGRIVYMGQNIPACSADPCPVYTPDQKARYVLELNSGHINTHHWKVGDQLNLKGILEN